MYSFIKDIRFLEGLTKKGCQNEKCFDKGYFICVVDNPLFYEVKKKRDGIYEYFRNGNLEAEGTYRNGDNEHGLLKLYNEEGELIKTMNCEDGVCRTVWKKDQNREEI